MRNGEEIPSVRNGGITELRGLAVVCERLSFSLFF